MMNEADFIREKTKPVTRTMSVLGSCVGCGYCESVCPTGAIQVIGTAEIDQNRCIGCGACAGRCPMSAIG